MLIVPKKIKKKSIIRGAASGHLIEIYLLQHQFKLCTALQRISIKLCYACSSRLLLQYATSQIVSIFLEKRKRTQKKTHQRTPDCADFESAHTECAALVSALG